jgi:hypothetical protein
MLLPLIAFHPLSPLKRIKATRGNCAVIRRISYRRLAPLEDGGPRSAAIADARTMLNGGLGWLEVECNRCKTRASLPLDAIRRPRDTPIWKLEAALKCRSCRKGRYAPPVHMIKLTETREITPYKWVHPDEER